MLTMRSGRNAMTSGHDDIAMSAYKDVDITQADFFMFLDTELEKIEEFYKSKEDDATARLKVLRDQLHIMRDRRYQEIVAAEHMSRKHPRGLPAERQGLLDLAREYGPEALFPSSHEANGRSKSVPWMKPIDHAIDRAKKVRMGKTFEAMKDLGTPTGPRAKDMSGRDYARKPSQHDIPYRTAKRKLKIAMAEFYRGLELLKSYALLNRTAFRKITKKFDKTVTARPTGRYMAEKVNKAYFVNSEVLDGHLHAVEDLYARYFERGSHKVAVGKLRAKSAGSGEYSGSVFRNGLFLAAGTVFGIQGIVYGGELIFHSDEIVKVQTEYLFQV